MHDLTESEANEPPRSARYWLNQVDAALQREKPWRSRAEKVVKRYMDERGDDENRESSVTRRVNILWSNTEILKSVLFAKLGAPDVRRLFPSAGQATRDARTAAMVMERSMIVCANRYDLDKEFEDAIEDHLLRGRGQVWAEYEADLSGEPGQEQIVYQSVRIVQVPDTDWTHGPGKRWSQVPWVARMHLFTKDDFKTQFPDFDFEEQKIPFSYTLAEGMDRSEEQGGNDFKRSKVWELWDKVSQTRIYFAEGYEWEIERTPDPLKLEGFFPCPPPLMAIKRTDSLIPQPEFAQYQDQASELDRINARIYVLVEALKYCGVYDASGDDPSLQDIGNLDDGQFLPFKNMRALAQGGGLAAAFQVRDLAPIAASIQQLAQRATILVQSIYEITGISDVIRGATDPNETLGAQQLKARFGSQRIQKRQAIVQRFVRNALRLKAEIIAEHFTRDQLVAMTGIPLPPAQEQMMAKMMVQQAEQMQAQQKHASEQAPAGMGHNGSPPMEALALAQPQQIPGQPMMGGESPQPGAEAAP